MQNLETWQLVLGSVAIISVMSLIGIIALGLGERLTQKIMVILVAFAVGALLGDAFIHILPQVYESGAHTVEVHLEEHIEHEDEHGHTHSNPLSAILIVGGILMFFSVEKVLRWRHCHHLPDDCDHAHPVAIMNLIGDGMHNVLDGVLVAASYMASVPIGIATTVAVLLHEVPQEIGDYATLRHAGFSLKKALISNFLIACTAFLGAAIVLIWSPDIEIIEGVLLPLTAGGFVYIAGSDLIPMLHEKTATWVSLGQIAAMVAGVGIMWGLTGLE